MKENGKQQEHKQTGQVAITVPDTQVTETNSEAAAPMSLLTQRSQRILPAGTPDEIALVSPTL